MRRYEFEETCLGCPHQFDVWDGDTKVAYIRYRWGCLSVNPYKPRKDGEEEQEIDFETTIFKKEFGGNRCGVLPHDKLEEILDKLDKEIQKYYQSDKE